MDRNYYYKILEIQPNATKEEITKAYKRVIRIYHPDAGVTNDAMIKDINEAYAMLSDDVKRDNYDSRQGQEEEKQHTENEREYSGNNNDSFRRSTLKVLLRVKEGVYADVFGAIPEKYRSISISLLFVLRKIIFNLVNREIFSFV